MRTWLMTLPLLTLPFAAFERSDEPAADTVSPKPADGDAPLAEGFPNATKPGTIEIKTYPAYRSAVATAKKVAPGAGDLLFWPLFNHIESNHIAMTAPVINVYKDAKTVETPGGAGEMSMEFVYRTPKEGKTGKAGLLVEVVDHPQQTYVCLGIQGGMSDTLMREGLGKLNTWLAEHGSEWKADGPPRRLGYHGPMTPARERLWEVQLPVKRASTEPTK